MIDLNKQPVILLGGFLIKTKSYLPIANWLKKEKGLKVKIIELNKLDWLITSWEYGWARILNKVNIEVKTIVETSSTKKVTLLGHSSGGVMLRLYLSDRILSGKRFNGKDYCNNLITLGSPHQAKRSTKLRGLVDKEYPGTYYSSCVNYASIGGRLNNKSKTTKLLTRLTAKYSYNSISGLENDCGDGLVPLSSSLLKDSKQIIMDGVSHGQIFGESWYGSEDVIEKWWGELLK
tara:strand:+ start:788 stop:1489 length:702 start_codon:yes stop_codon:yes gene_type:complete